MTHGEPIHVPHREPHCNHDAVAVVGGVCECGYVVHRTASFGQCYDCGGLATIMEVQQNSDNGSVFFQFLCETCFIGQRNWIKPIHTAIKGYEAINLSLSEEATCTGCGACLIADDAIKDPVIYDDDYPFEHERDRDWRAG